jgi:putative transposase
VSNRRNARATVFHKPDDYDAFVDMMAEASVRVPMRNLAYCLMPNRFRLALWPRQDGDLSRMMHRLMTTHVCCYLRHDRSSGHVWQGRFETFLNQEDEHLLTVLRYIERHPLRSGLVDRAKAWRWSSLHWHGDPARSPSRLEQGTLPLRALWLEGVNAATADIGLEDIRESVRRDRPFGSSGWTLETAKALGLEYSLRPRGRPKGEPEGRGESASVSRRAGT